FVPQEGPVWDFKREWPFSYSDDYFAGIARLICAFANSYGGIIVFGVHDELRTAGLRRTSGNYDRAVHLFEEGSGEDVRSYVFQREWNSLPPDNYGRYFLAILALHRGGPNIPISEFDVARSSYQGGKSKASWPC